MPGPTWRSTPQEMMRPKPAATLEAKWKDCSWYHKPSASPGEPRHPQDNLNLRLRRALSWLKRAEAEYEGQDFDAAFIFHWIGFNAAYGQRGPSSDEDSRDWKDRRDYFTRIARFVESERVIYDTIWGNLLDQIKAVLGNRFVYEPYWKFRNGVVKHRNWKEQFDTARDEIEDAINHARTEEVLREMFCRLYTLRNQLLHGGATLNSSVNRNQVEPGATIMSFLVPHFIDVMIEHPDGWGAPRYPVVRESGPQSGWTGGN